MNLKNKIVVITGGTSGLGKSLAIALLKEQAKVVINGKNKKELQVAAREIGAAYCLGDVTREKDMQRLAAFAVKKFKRIDIWINNAGIGAGHKSIEKIDSVMARKTMEVNFFGTFFGSRSAMKYMKKQKSGIILNVISTRAIIPSPLSAVYSSSKWAVRGFTELLRAVLEEYGVSVVAVYPSGMKTNFFGKTKPVDYEKYMDPSYVAGKIVQNLKFAKPKAEIIIKK